MSMASTQRDTRFSCTADSRSHAWLKQRSAPQRPSISTSQSRASPKLVTMPPLAEFQCPICHEPFDDAEMSEGLPLKFLPCLHKFHTPCYQNYLNDSRRPESLLKCPVCRATPQSLLATEQELLRPSRSTRPVDSDEEISIEDDSDEPPLDSDAETIAGETAIAGDESPLEVAQAVEPEVAQAVEPEVAHVVEPEVAQAVEPEVAQVVEPEVAQPVEPEVAQAVESEPGTQLADVPRAADTQVDDTRGPPPELPAPRVRRTRRAAAKAASSQQVNTLAAAFARTQSSHEVAQSVEPEVEMPSSPTGVVDAAFDHDVPGTVIESQDDAPLVESVAVENVKGNGKRKRADSNNATRKGKGKKARKGANVDAAASDLGGSGASVDAGAPSSNHAGKGAQTPPTERTDGGKAKRKGACTDGGKANGKRARTDGGKAEGKRCASPPNDAGAASSNLGGKGAPTPPIDIADDDPLDILKGKGKRRLNDGEAKGDGKGKVRRLSGDADSNVDAQVVPWSQQTVQAPRAPPSGFEREAVCEPCDEAEMLFCNWCKSPCELARMRVTAKQSAKFKCDRCQTTFAKCNKSLGSWPQAQFLELSEEEQTAFYQQAAQLRSANAVAQLFSNKIERFKTRQDVWAFGGEYRPLKYWETLGYDPERIVRFSNANDVIETAQAGTCYRVRVLSAGTEGATGTMQTLTWSAGDAPAAPLALENGSVATAATQPETNADFAARFQKEKEMRKTKEKQLNARRAAASQLLKKLAGPLESLKNALNVSTIQQLSPGLIKSAVDARVTAEDEVLKINACIDNMDGEYDPSSPLTKEALAVWKAHLHEG